MVHPLRLTRGRFFLSIQLPSYLLRSRHAVFYFRIVVPQDIRKDIGQTEIRVSLKTCQRDQAIAKSTLLRVWFYSWFDTIRSMDKPKIELWKTEGRFHCYKLILGHKIDDITFETYSGPFRPQVTKIVIDELDWHLNLTKYQPPVKTEARKRLQQWRREKVDTKT